MIPVNFTIIKKSRCGHRYILEPQEREEFRERCKYNELKCICDKGHYTYIRDGKSSAILLGCTPNVRCPRMKRWDVQHGIENPYTMVEKEEDLHLLYGERKRKTKNKYY